MEEKPKRKQTWNEMRSKKPPKPVRNSTVSEVKTYVLTPEELEYYRNLKPPIPERQVRTTAPRSERYLKKRGQT